MNGDKMSPEKSLELITKVITEARNRFEENGFIYVFWGALTGIAAFGQFVLLVKEFYTISWYPYMLIPLGFVYTMYYYRSKKRERHTNHISVAINRIWVLLSVNMMGLGFFFHSYLERNLIPVILIILAIGIMISAVNIKSRMLFFSSIFINVSACVAFLIDWLYQPLLMGIVSLTAIMIPGIFLMVQHKQYDVQGA